MLAITCLTGGHHQPLFDQATANNLVNLADPKYMPKCDVSNIPVERMFPPESIVLLGTTFQCSLWEWVGKRNMGQASQDRKLQLPSIFVDPEFDELKTTINSQES